MCGECTVDRVKERQMKIFEINQLEQREAQVKWLRRLIRGVVVVGRERRWKEIERMGGKRCR